MATEWAPEGFQAQQPAFGRFASRFPAAAQPRSDSVLTDCLRLFSGFYFQARDVLLSQKSQHSQQHHQGLSRKPL